MACSSRCYAKAQNTSRRRRNTQKKSKDWQEVKEIHTQIVSKANKNEYKKWCTTCLTMVNFSPFFSLQVVIFLHHSLYISQIEYILYIILIFVVVFCFSHPETWIVFLLFWSLINIKIILNVPSGHTALLCSHLFRCMEGCDYSKEICVLLHAKSKSRLLVKKRLWSSIRVRDLIQDKMNLPYC